MFHPVRTSRAPRRAALLALVMLSACGGGDGGGDADPLDPLPDTNPDTLGLGFVSSFAAFEAAAANLRDNVSRYLVQRGFVALPDHPGTPVNEAGTRLSYPLASARVEYAHAVGLTGAGQTIAVVDEGFLQTHEVFAGKTTQSVGAPGVEDHGTMVASIAAGNSGTMIGVAPGADLIFGSWNDPALATRRALDAGAVVQNNSWGFSGLYATRPAFDNVFVNDPGGIDYLDALRAYAAQGVVVFAVNNDQLATQAGLMPALPQFDASLHAGWLAVANAVPTYSNADVTDVALYSSPCLEAARWCLMADGFWYAATSGATDAYAAGTGASFAAPMVSGAMALLAEAFPTLTPHQLRLRLLASADNSFTGFASAGRVELTSGFFHDYSTLYGHGFLDLRAALLPIGPVAMQHNDGTPVAPEKVVFSVGSATGDAIARGLDGVDFALSDSFSGDFKVAGAAIATPTAPQSLAQTLLRRGLTAAPAGGAAPALRTAFADHAGQTLSFADAETGLRAELLLPPEGSAASDYGLALTQPLLSGPLRLDLGVKVARDEGALLGFGADSAPASRLAAVNLTLARDFDNGAFVALQAEMGVADMGRPAAMSRLSQAGFSSMGFSLGRRGVFARGDRLALGVSLPTAVTSGQATFDLKVVNAQGAPEARAVAVGLAPDDREIDLSLSYEVPLGRRSDLRLELVHAENHGNRAGLRDTAGGVALRFRF